MMTHLHDEGHDVVLEHVSQLGLVGEEAVQGTLYNRDREGDRDVRWMVQGRGGRNDEGHG